jgi:Xaa-Pro aminopeptidase
MKYETISPKLYSQNRARFSEKMMPNSIAIFPTNPVLPENGDATLRYRANTDVLWLSGITQEKTMVILYPDNPDKNAR